MRLASIAFAALSLSIATSAARAAEAPITPAAAAANPPAGVAVKVLAKTATSWDGAALRYPDGQAELTLIELRLEPGAALDWHTHPAPSLGYVVEGEWTVMLADGREAKLKAGDTLAEVVGTVHRGRNSGSTPARLIAVFAGARGLPLSTPAAAP